MSATINNIAVEGESAGGFASDVAGDRSMLIVDDDDSFRERLTRAMEDRGFEVFAAASVSEGLQAALQNPAFAIIEMRFADGNGVDVIASLKQQRSDARTIMLTAYGNLTTSVTAVKLGAFDVLAKPTDADEILML